MDTVKQRSKLAGITPRALRFYDSIGLLKPSRVGDNGYRYYGEEALLRLQQILLYRELDLPLAEIRQIMAQPGFDVPQALTAHKTELRRRIHRLERLIETVEHTLEHLKGTRPMTESQMFDVFNDEQQVEFQKEALEMYDPAVVRASYQRWQRYTPAEKQRIGAEGEAVYRAFLAAMPQGPESAAAQAAVAAWRSHMDYFWTPTDAQLLGIAGGYVSDPRFKANFDKLHPDLAAFVHAAVTVYVARRGQAGG